MKKLLSFVTILTVMTSLNAQQFTPVKNKKIKKDDISVTVNESEVARIDWNYFKDYFSDKKENDSVQLGVKIISPKKENIRSEKKYSVRGIKKNIDTLISTLQRMLD